jgi:hypothetical protein
MTTAPPGAGNRSGCCHERQCAGPGSCCFSVFSSHFPQPGRPWPRWPCQSSAGRGRPTSIASAPVKSPTSAPSPPACGDRRPASARRAGRCSSGEGFGGYAAVTTARMVWPASQLRRPARLAQVTIAASNRRRPNDRSNSRRDAKHRQKLRERRYSRPPSRLGTGKRHGVKGRIRAASRKWLLQHSPRKGS